MTLVANVNKLKSCWKLRVKKAIIKTIKINKTNSVPQILLDFSDVQHFLIGSLMVQPGLPQFPIIHSICSVQQGKQYYSTRSKKLTFYGRCTDPGAGALRLQAYHGKNYRHIMAVATGVLCVY